MKKIFLILLAIFSLSACHSLKNSTSQNEKKPQSTMPSIENILWETKEKNIQHAPSLKISNHRIFGFAGCNNYSAKIIFNQDKTRFTISDISSTKVFCNKMSKEDAFLKTLKNANRYELNKDVLKLYQDELLLIKFIKSSKK